MNSTETNPPADWGPRPRRQPEKRRVLVAHQSTIPHYRIPFYEAVQRLKPGWWDLGVVCDSDPRRRSLFFVEPIDDAAFGFNVVPTRTFAVAIGGKKIAFQSFVLSAGRFDLIVVEDAVHNLSYPLARLWRLKGIPLAYWGHGRDTTASDAGFWKQVAEGVKRRWVLNSEGYFAYTEGVRADLIDRGVPSDRVFQLNNTIDILAERESHQRHAKRREELRRSLGLDGKRALLYVGRLDPRKHLDLLGQAMRHLLAVDSDYRLVVIGGGDGAILDALIEKVGSQHLSYRGVIVDREELAAVFAASDAYVFPGDVGLGVVHALCHSLTPVVVARGTHNPEFEYLNEHNSVVVSGGIDPGTYARAIHDLVTDRVRWAALRENAWASIRHLTIEAMARHFVAGISSLLERSGKGPPK